MAFRSTLIVLAAGAVACTSSSDGAESTTTAPETGDDAATTMMMMATSTDADPTGDPTTLADPSTDGEDDTTSTSDTTSAVDDTTTGPQCEGEYTPVRGCDDPVGESFCSEGQRHVPAGTDVRWGNNPPHSGPHYPTWVSWTEHPRPVPRGNWVHNLEHGGIVFSYRCDEPCEAELDVLRQVMTDRPDLRILLTPDPDLDAPRFAAVSWTWVYETDAPDLDTLLCFVDQHENHAPEDVP
jgi:hypothetical protein